MSPICSGDLTTVHEHGELSGCLQAVRPDEVAQTGHTLHAVWHRNAGTGLRAGAREVGLPAGAAGVMGPCALEVSPGSGREVSCYLLISSDS